MFGKIKGKVERLSVMGGDQGVADCSRRKSFIQKVSKSVKVAFGFGHFFAINNEMGGMEPVANEWLARVALRLGYFIFMVGEEIVNAPTMDIDRFS